MSRQDAGLAVMVLVLAFMLLIGTAAYQHLEGWNTIQSFYFSVSTITMVGLGDMYPTSDASRLFTAFYMLIGVSLGLVILTFMGSMFFANAQARVSRPQLRRPDASLVKRDMPLKKGKKKD